MSTYTATITRDELGYWIARVPTLTGVHTNAKRLDQIAGRVAEAISLATGDDPANISVDIDVDLASLGLDDDDAEQVRQAEALRSDLEAIEERLKVATRRAASRLTDVGLSLRDASALLGVSYQRVHQITREQR